MEIGNRKKNGRVGLVKTQESRGFCYTRRKLRGRRGLFDLIFEK